MVRFGDRGVLGGEYLGEKGVVWVFTSGPGRPCSWAFILQGNGGLLYSLRIVLVTSV